MTEPLVSELEIESLREYALTGMQSEIQIFHKTSAPNDFSDDGEVYPVEPDLVVMGWFRNAANQGLTEEMQALQQVDEGRLFLPVGTAIARGDKAIVAGNAWTVVDTNDESTYRVVTRVSLRREN